MGFLRLFLAVSVLVFHFGSLDIGYITPVPGVASVFCFFVISGYYMEMVLHDRYSLGRLGVNWVYKFYLSRLLRLYPVYISTLIIICLGFCFDLLKTPAALMDFGLKSIVLWVISLLMIGLNIPSTSDLLIGPSWSLGVEISFYFLAPYVSRFGAKFVLGVVSIGFLFQFIPYGQHLPFLFGFHWFFLGMFVFRHQERLLDFVDRYVKLRIVHFLLIFLLVLFFPVPDNLYFFRYDDHAHSSVDRFVYPVVTAFFIPFLFRITAKNQIDNFVGKLSYPFYLVHDFVMQLLSHLMVDFKFLIVFVSVLLLSISFVILEDAFVEPLRRRFSRSI